MRYKQPISAELLCRDSIWIKEKTADDLIKANKELSFQPEEKGKCTVELIVIKKEHVF